MTETKFRLKSKIKHFLVWIYPSDYISKDMSMNDSIGQGAGLRFSAWALVIREGYWLARAGQGSSSYAWNKQIRSLGQKVITGKMNELFPEVFSDTDPFSRSLQSSGWVKQIRYWGFNRVMSMIWESHLHICFFTKQDSPQAQSFYINILFLCSLRLTLPPLFSFPFFFPKCIAFVYISLLF